jgi:hypothetical protein
MIVAAIGLAGAQGGGDAGLPGQAQGGDHPVAQAGHHAEAVAGADVGGRQAGSGRRLAGGVGGGDRRAEGAGAVAGRDARQASPLPCALTPASQAGRCHDHAMLTTTLPGP